MKEKPSRRTLLQALAAASAIPAVDAQQSAAQEPAAQTPPQPNDLERITTGDLIATFGTAAFTRSRAHRTVCIRTLWGKFRIPAVISTVWAPPQAGGQRRGINSSRQTTVESTDNRKVWFDGKAFTVRYEGRSARPGGIEAYDLELEYRPAPGNSLALDVPYEMSVMGLGEIGFPWPMNCGWRLRLRPQRGSKSARRRVDKWRGATLVGGDSVVAPMASGEVANFAFHNRPSQAQRNGRPQVTFARFRIEGIRKIVRLRILALACLTTTGVRRPAEN